MSHKTSFCFIVLSLVALFSYAEESPLAVIPFDTPDPTAVTGPDSKGLYVFATGRGIQILYSSDWLNWERKDRVFSRDRFSNNIPDWVPKHVPGVKGIWAPDVVFMNDKYYVYYSASTFGGQRSVIGLASNKTLDSTNSDYQWIDEGIVLESAPEKTDYNAIDSALFVDDDGKAYLYWGSYWTGLKAVEVDPKTGKPFKYRDGDLKVPADYIPIASRRDTSIEAPYVMKRGKYYYLFTSRGGCCDGVKSTYHIAVGRSEKPLGPYVDKDGVRMDENGGTVFLTSTGRWKGTGHNGIFSTSDGKKKTDWLILAAYDAKEPEKGRKTQIRSLEWDAADWPVPGEIVTKPFTPSK